MKTRESGMPEESLWEAFFDVDHALEQLLFTRISGSVAEFGCGYGTFTIPAARRTMGMIYAFDIEPSMVELTATKVRNENLKNVCVSVRDFVADGTGLASEFVEYAMLFNILHAENPKALLREAWRILQTGGYLGIMHWNYDSSTPRGPSMEIRPRPEECLSWAQSIGFQLVGPGIIDLRPYHYGMVLQKQESNWTIIPEQ